MKKSTLIIIGLIYIASIVVISVFGLKAVVYRPIIPVTRVECLNESDEFTTVDDSNEGLKVITVDYRGAADKNDLTKGTVLQLKWRVLPDNASQKNVMFQYRDDLTSFEFIQGEDGRELGMILFYGTVNSLRVKIVATDGSGLNEQIIIRVRIRKN